MECVKSRGSNSLTMTIVLFVVSVAISLSYYHYNGYYLSGMSLTPALFTPIYQLHLYSRALYVGSLYALIFIAYKDGFNKNTTDVVNITVQIAVAIFSLINLVTYIMWNNYAWGDYITKSDPYVSYGLISLILAFASVLVMSFCSDYRYSLAVIFVQIDFLLSKYMYWYLYLKVEREEIDKIMVMMLLIGILFVLAVLGLIPAKLAKSKGGKFLPWFIYGMFGTFFAIPHAVSVKKRNDNPL